MSNNANSTKQQSPSTSYSVFAEVDEMVAKPVLGTDGAMAWQDFRGGGGAGGGAPLYRSRGTAPHAPVKKADRLGTGMKSVREERANEERVRVASGEASMGVGYTIFKEKHGGDGGDDSSKARALAEARVRPDDVPYFIESESKTFDGWKKDYVFTTRSRGTGYYWDGTDSARDAAASSSASPGAEHDHGGGDGEDRGEGEGTPTTAVKERRKRKKRKKKAREGGEGDDDASVDVSNNPMEQVANAIARRNASAALSSAMGAASVVSTPAAAAVADAGDGGSSAADLAAAGWVAAVDRSSGRTYYYHGTTKETKWENPLLAGNKAAGSTSGGRPISGNDNSDRGTGTKTDTPLPPGWKTATDANGKTYYYNHKSGKTCWDRPWV